jgi:excisionase family DNA binding protein
MPPLEKTYLSTKEAAQYLGLGESTLEKLRLTGRGPRYSRPLRKIIYYRDDLDSFVAAHRRLSTSEVGAAA